MNGAKKTCTNKQEPRWQPEDGVGMGGRAINWCQSDLFGLCELCLLRGEAQVGQADRQPRPAQVRPSRPVHQPAPAVQ